MIQRASGLRGETNRKVHPVLFKALKAAAAIPLSVAILGIFSQTAWAHEGTAQITCSSVTFTYLDFPDTTGNTVHEAVFIDGIKSETDKFTFNHSSGHNSLSLFVVGSATIEAKASWHTNGADGAFSVTQEVSDCGGIG
jgi:hypothetical protein